MSFVDYAAKGSFGIRGAIQLLRRHRERHLCADRNRHARGVLEQPKRFDEFSILLGYLLGQPRVLSIPRGNVTSRLPNPAHLPPKTALSLAEREAAVDLLKDDIWFYQEAAKEYDRRISNFRLEPVFSEVLALVQVCGKAIPRVIAMRDPANPTRRALQRVK
jgi:hypothetical protein